MKTNHNQIFSTLNQRRLCKEPVLEVEDECIEEEQHDLSTQFLQTQKKQLLDLKDQVERYCNVLLVPALKTAKNGIILVKSYLLSLPVIERVIEPLVIQKPNQFVSFSFGNAQFLDLLGFLGRTTSLGFFSKAYRTSETKSWFSYEWFDDPEMLNSTQLLP